MPRETKEQRLERERLEQERQNAENAEFLKNLPMTVIQLMARVEKRHDASCAVYEADGLHRVEFKFRVGYNNGDERDFYENEVNVYLQTDYTWQLRDSVDDVVRELERREAADAEAARQRKIAQDAYDGLSEEQRKALGLTRRP